MGNEDFIIYQITNKINGKIYIGQTTCGISKRWLAHKYASKKKTGKLYNAFNKYGIDNFSIEVITTASSIDELNELEERIIAEKDSVRKGYNIQFGGLNYSRLNKKGLTREQTDFIKKFKTHPIELQCVLLAGMVNQEAKRYIDIHGPIEKTPSENDEIIDKYIKNLKAGTWEYRRKHLLNMAEIICQCNENTINAT